jgi:hypothetical protein
MLVVTLNEDGAVRTAELLVAPLEAPHEQW